MRTGKGTLAVMLTGVGLIAASGGCKSLDEYRQLEMHNKTLQAEKAQLESDVYDCRSVTDNLRTKLTSVEGELDTKQQLVGNLQRENDRLATKCNEMTKIVETMADKGLPEPVVIVDKALPPELDNALKSFAAQYPNAVSYDDKRGAVKWSSDLLFALGSDVVKDSAKASLTKFAEIIRSPAAADFALQIVGHTDNLPIKRSSTAAAHPTNWHLSVHRAIAVGTLLDQMGVDPARIGVGGFSEYHPIADNSTEEGRAKNRRVEIYLVPKEALLTGGGATGEQPHHAAAPGNPSPPKPATGGSG
jgi:chemotaxis protein MotB